MMSQELDLIFNKAVILANRLKHEYLTIETVMLVLLEEKEIQQIFHSLEVDWVEIRKELTDFLNSNDNFSLLSDEEIEDLSCSQFIDDKVRELARAEGIVYRPEMSLALQRSLQRAAIHVQSAGKSQISALNLLVSIFDEEESFTLYLLDKNGANRFEVLKAVAHSHDTPLTDQLGESSEGESKSEIGHSKVLEEYTTNLNQLVHDNKIDPLIGREKELEQIIQTL
jgi:ATP-dependent Clp protease ATP-binding subunit ClpA